MNQSLGSPVFGSKTPRKTIEEQPWLSFEPNWQNVVGVESIQSYEQKLKRTETGDSDFINFDKTIVDSKKRASVNYKNSSMKFAQQLSDVPVNRSLGVSERIRISKKMAQKDTKTE